ncbi:MAG: hypothetical protein NCW75_12480 [Phycisphaera sp.]|nr:MAG: hypothetical protein NCW75_12480 [Phycisphaera sp.]
MKKCVVLAALLLLASRVLAQEGVDIGPVEIFNPGAPTGDAPAAEAASTTGWADHLTPAVQLGLTMVAIGVPMLVVVLGRLWRRLPEGERAFILLSVAMGRGRGFRARLRSLAASGKEHDRPISPIAMLLAPRAFDAALDRATRAERAFGVPQRHAVHGFRKG